MNAAGPRGWIRSRLTALLLAALALAPTLLADTRSSAIVNEVGDAYLKVLAAQDPELSLKLNLPVQHLPDLSLAQEDRDASTAAALLVRLGSAGTSELTHEEALSKDVLENRLKALTDATRFHWLRFPITPYASPLNSLRNVFAVLPVTDPGTAGRYLALLEEYPAFVDSIQKALEGGMARGIVLPREELDLALPFLNSYLGDIDSSPYAVASGRLAALPRSEAESFRSRLAGVLDKDVNAPLKRLVTFLAGDYRSKAPEAVGPGQYPGGTEYYNWLVRLHTTMEVTPQEVHAIGLSEVARIDSEMAKVRDRVGFKGTPAEFRESLRKDPRFFPKNPEEIGERLMGHVRRIEPKVDAFFLRKPRAPYGVKRLEPQLEQGQTFGYYQEPLGADPRGYYRFNGSRLSERSLLNAAALIFHELVPGHHFQINLARENEALPRFRREITDTAYAEGWGEYASLLAGEMGMYEDPYDLYGRLSMDMFVSTRLVVDTGMNALGWSRARAMQFMRDHLMESETQIATESLRYSCDIPAQALAYKMGARRILELREEARHSLGPRFDIRRFHDAVLGEGSLPLSTLERHIHWFVERQSEP
jgi:uncharacterized protein (DUF885 family)